MSAKYIELFPEIAPGAGRLNHISIETENAEAMRQYLASRGIAVPKQVPKGRIGNSNFNIKDPEGIRLRSFNTNPMDGRFGSEENTSRRTAFPPE